MHFCTIENLEEYIISPGALRGRSSFFKFQIPYLNLDPPMNKIFRSPFKFRYSLEFTVFQPPFLLDPTHDWESSPSKMRCNVYVINDVQ